MATRRKVKYILSALPTMEGAGVKLNRVFGYGQLPDFDPFLLLDAFGSYDASDYKLGFPWHPHRGIETITYMKSGEVEHQDSLGNKGVIGPGDVQWMTAGSGIIHQEMPLDQNGKLLSGFQLWANLPASDKMTTPKYRDITDVDIPQLNYSDGTNVRLICGELDGITGPVSEITVDPFYMDISMTSSCEFDYYVPEDYTVFAYVYEGGGIFDHDEEFVGQKNIVLYEKGESISIKSTDTSLKFLLIGGKPLNEPIAWNGPIVMNTNEELQVAFSEYQNGTFIK